MVSVIFGTTFAIACTGITIITIGTTGLIIGTATTDTEDRIITDDIITTGITTTVITVSDITVLATTGRAIF